MRAICAVLAALFAAGSASAASYVAIDEMAGGYRTTVQGINAKNQIVGFYYNTGDIAHGFTGPVGGPYTILDVGTAQTYARAINNLGTIVGNAHDVDDPWGKSFERYADGRTMTVKKAGKPMVGAVVRGLSKLGVFVGNGFFDGHTFSDVPFLGQKAKYTGEMESALYLAEPHAINASNVIVGFFLSGGDRGFILKDGVATQIDYPDAKNVNGTRLNGINDEGIVTGRWLDQHHRPHAFKYDMNAATFTPLHPPGTLYSEAWGINDKGLIALVSDIGSFIYCPNANRCPAGGSEIADAPSIHAKPRR